MIKRNNCLILFGVWMFFVLGIPRVDAAVIGVTTTADNGPGSLRAAITEANTNSEADTIILPAGTYKLSGPVGEDGNLGGDLDFNSPHKISVVGAGMGETIIDGNELDRVLHIYSGVVSISGVTIKHGKTREGMERRENGENGGGIYNSGTLTLKDCSIQENRCGYGATGYAHPRDMFCPGGGGHGGGIYNTGSLTMTGSRIIGNSAGQGGGAITGCGDFPRGGNGGGIYNSNTGAQVLDNCTISNNSSGNGGGSGGTDNDLDNGGGHGGGIYSEGTQTLRNCTISFNMTGSARYGSNCGDNQEYSGHGGGIYNYGLASMGSCIIKKNFTGVAGRTLDRSGAGGGIYNRSTLSLEDCTIAENYTGIGGGSGGGLFHREGALTLLNCTISNNYTGDGGESGFGVNGGHGGGIRNVATLTLTHCTISNNKAGKGGAASGNNGGNGGSGGGIHSTGDVILTHCTIASNTTSSGGTGGTNNGNIDGFPGDGGGIYASKTDGSLQLENTIIADNHVFLQGLGPDYFGPLYSKGYNLLENSLDCEISGTLKGNIMGIDPLLAPLADNGGPTLTHALLQGSPAIDAGFRAGFATDQRGYPRPVDILTVTNVYDGTDIGAYEEGLTPTLPPRISLNRNRLVFGADLQGNHTGSQVIALTNSGGGTLSWNATFDAEWLHCTPVSGTGAASLTLSMTSPLTTGTYSTTLTITDPMAENSPQQVEVVLFVYGNSAAGSPVGVLDSPVSGTTVSGSIPVTGWAVDLVGIKNIKLFREPVAGEGNELIYIGDCIRVEGARPDVTVLYPDCPESTQAGWGYMLLTNFLPSGGNGSFTLHVIATDIKGNQATLGKTVIFSDNAHAVKPFGTIDSPAQGGTVSGNRYVNFGWALTPRPNTIPFNGSTITVWVDGVILGHPVYNQPREDIIALFPGYNNTQGAVGYYYLDTRSYVNGVHTIAWSVMDDAGNTEGIGSRYFTIQNTETRKEPANEGISGATSGKPEFFKEENTKNDEYENGAVRVRTGYNLKSPARTIYPDHTGQINIDIQALERLEINLGVGLDSVPGTISIAAPPIGSYLDAKKGIFYWQPGVGFLGEYPLNFQIKTSAGDIQEKQIIVQIKPYK